jgi:L-ascorbate metabolism protein UlaG (beta-lactamase superfamily)
MRVGNLGVLHLKIASIAWASRAARRGPAGGELAALGFRIMLALIPGVLGGCGGSIAGLPVYSGVAELRPGDPGYPTTVQVRYLGAGGVVIRRGDDVILTAPFFSNPSIPRVAFGEIRALPDEIDRFFKPGDSYLSAPAILVGHSHYDHLMDVPYIKVKYMPGVKVYGNNTMQNILAGDPAIKPADVFTVQPTMGSATKVGQWWPAGSRIRFMALISEHAPIIAGISFFEGDVDAPLKTIPTRASGWLEGQTLAYLIDFLGADGKVEYRIHYQDAASNQPLGFPPPLAALDDPRPVDLALVCMPGSNEVKGYPDDLLARLTPRHIVLIHWENFFERLPDDSHDLHTVPHEAADKFMAHLATIVPAGGDYTLPAPGAWMRFAP